MQSKLISNPTPTTMNTTYTVTFMGEYPFTSEIFKDILAYLKARSVTDAGQPRKDYTIYEDTERDFRVDMQGMTYEIHRIYECTVFCCYRTTDTRPGTGFNIGPMLNRVMFHLEHLIDKYDTKLTRFSNQAYLVTKFGKSTM